MKKIITITVFAAAMLLLPAMLKADPVSRQTAAKVAENFLKADTRAGGLTLIWDGLDNETRAGGEAPLFYIFNRDSGGWVMIAGDDSLDPIQAYSYEGRFEVKDMPENLAEHMELYKEQVRNARKRGDKSDKAAWIEAQTPTRAGDTIPMVKLLSTPLYNQGNPWNLKCPTIDGKHALAGCCAIAQAIIMAYHKYPESGTGTVGGYSTSKYEAPAVVLGYKYDWDNILPRYKKGTYNEAQADAIATLVRDIALMGRSSFGLSGTGAYANTMPRRARTYFHYSAHHWDSHSQYTHEEWVALIKDAVNQNLPINYASNSHSYVCDGYDARGNIHFNYGWGGQSNGYYNIKGKTAYGACFSQRPEENYYGASIKVTLISATGYAGITSADNRPVVKGTEFNLKVGAVHNRGWDDGKVEWVLAHTDKDLKVKEIVTDIHTVTLGDDVNYSSVKGICNEDIVLGDKLVAMYRIAGTQAWERMIHTVYSDTFHGEFEMTGTPLEEQTSLEYDREKKTFIFAASDRTLNYKLFDANGNEVPDAIAGRYEKVVVYGDKLTPGTYTVQISQKNYIDAINVKIKVR